MNEDHVSHWNRWSAEHFRETGEKSYPKKGHNFSELHLACRVGSIERVVQAVRYGADIEGRAISDARPLHIACDQGKREVVQFLLKIGANVNAKDLSKQTPMFKVNGLQTEGLIADLCQHGADVHVRDFLNRTALDVACMERNFQKVQALAAKGLDPVQLNMRIACANGDLDIIQCLIDNGADVAKFSSKRLSLLHFAAYNNHLDVAKLLVERGCTLNCPDDVSPLHLAVFRGHVSMVQFLLRSGSDPNARGDGRGVTPLHYACSLLQPGIVEDLLEYGANPNAKDDERFSPFFYLLHNECSSDEACDSRLVQLLAVLLENGIQLEHDQETCCRESHRSDNSVFDFDLYEVIVKGRFETIQCLIKAGMRCKYSCYDIEDWLRLEMDDDPLQFLRVSRWCLWQYAAGVEVLPTGFLKDIVLKCDAFLERLADGFVFDETKIVDAIVKEAKLNLEWLLKALHWPRPLFFLCCVRVRGLLRASNGFNIFPAVNLLQVPRTVKDALKLSHLPPKLGGLPAVP